MHFRNVSRVTRDLLGSEVAVTYQNSDHKNRIVIGKLADLEPAHVTIFERAVFVHGAPHNNNESQEGQEDNFVVRYSRMVRIAVGSIVRVEAWKMSSRNSARKTLSGLARQ